MCERGDVSPSIKEADISIQEFGSRNEATQSLHGESEFSIKTKFRLQNARPFQWLMGGYAVVPAISIDTTGNTITFADADPDTITRANGSWITDGIEVGNAVVISGSSSNDGSYTATIVTALVITLTVTADSLAAESMTTGSLLVSPPYTHSITNSNIIPSYSIEHVINKTTAGTNDYSHKFLGSKCDELSLTMTKGQTVICEATFLAGGYEKDPTPGTNVVDSIVPYEFHQATILTVNGIDYKLKARQLVLTMNNGLEREYSLCSRDAEGISEGIRKFMATLEIYEVDDTLQDLFENRTDFAISIVITRGTDTITIAVANAKIFEPSWDLGGNAVVDILPIRVIGDWTVTSQDDETTYDN